MTLKEKIMKLQTYKMFVGEDTVYVERDDVLKLLGQEPRKGHWIEERNDYGEITHWHCSNCYDDSGFITTCKWDFCPECGSDNREAVEE